MNASILVSALKVILAFWGLAAILIAFTMVHDVYSHPSLDAVRWGAFWVGLGGFCAGYLTCWLLSRLRTRGHNT